MTPRHKNRVALFICLLLVGQEFTHARHLKNQFHKHHDEKKEDIEENTDYHKDKTEDGKSLDGDDYTQAELEYCTRRTEELKQEQGRGTIPHSLVDMLHRQPLAEEGGGKKGWINANLIFKGFKIFSTGVGFITSLGGIAHSIKMAIDGCCDAANKEACAYKDKYEAAGNTVKALSKTVDDLQLNAEIAQMWIGKVSHIFFEILDELERIDALETLLVQEISADYQNVTEEAWEKIKQLVKAKNNTLDGIPFVEVDALFQSTIEKALGISFSILDLAIPTLFTVYQYSRYKARMRRLGYIEMKENVKFTLPKSSSSSSLYEEMKFKRWTARKWIKTRIKSQISDLKNNFKNKFKAIVKKYGETIAGAIGGMLNLASSGYSIYKMIDAEKQCADTREKIKCAYIQTKEAEKTINGQIQDIRNQTDIMMEVWGIVRGNITDPSFLRSLNETAVMMAGAGRQSEETQNIAAGIYDFINTINATNDYKATYDAGETLYKAVGKIPYSMKCYISKTNALNNVLTSCKAGDKSLNHIIQSTKTLPESRDPGDLSDPRNCKDRLGFLYLEEENLKEAWTKMAEEEGYHRLCLMNKKINRDYICRMMKNDLKSAEQIATAFKHWSKDDVEDVMNVLRKNFPASHKRPICRERKENKDNPKELEKRLRFFIKHWYKMEDILAVKCPAPAFKKGEPCITDEAFSTKQLEREKKENKMNNKNLD